MDFQQWVDSQINSARKKRMSNSDQLTLGKLIEKIEPLADREATKEVKEQATVKYDFEYLFPTELDSWRGSYAELALNFSDYDRGKRPLTVIAFCEILKEAIGKTFYGYKGVIL